jgi:hypothetical protein
MQIARLNAFEVNEKHALCCIVESAKRRSKHLGLLIEVRGNNPPKPASQQKMLQGLRRTDRIMKGRYELVAAA